MKAEYNKVVAEIMAEMKADGIELPTFMESLAVTETERLLMRRFYEKDLGSLFEIMKKPEVMYAWENGFKRGETRKWLDRQYDRYRRDGFGYFAVFLKASGKLIGQAGLMKAKLNDEHVVEIGYIFDNSVWGNGYAIEAARACVGFAFDDLELDRLYATIRPENTASIKLALNLGMRKVGEIVKTYQGKEMPHDVYVLERGTSDIYKRHAE